MSMEEPCPHPALAVNGCNTGLWMGVYSTKLHNIATLQARKSVSATDKSMAHNTGFRATRVDKDGDLHYANMLHATTPTWRRPTPHTATASTTPSDPFPPPPRVEPR